MTRRRSLEYYDKILLAIAVSLGGGSLAGVATDIEFRLGLLAGALLATVFVYDATLRNPPRPPESARGTGALLGWHLLLVLLWLPDLL